MSSCPTTPKKTPASRSRTGSSRKAKTEDWGFLKDPQTTPTLPGSSRRQARTSGKKVVEPELSPLSALANENWSISKSPHQGRTSEAFLLERQTSDDSDEMLFVKKMLIMSPDNDNDKAYREEKILRELKDLSDKGLCFNFVNVVLSGTTSENDFMELVMERGGKPLNDWKEIPLDTLREILFQLLYALHVAQRELRFVHYDLHDKNVLIEDFPSHQGGQIELSDGSVFYLHRALIKIADFALARIEKRDGESVGNTKHATRAAFDPSHDVRQFADCISRLQITDRAQRVEEMRLLKQLKMKMRASETGPEQLLKHPFFEPMTKKPGKDVKMVLVAKDRQQKKMDEPLQDISTTPRASPRRRGLKML